MIQAMLFSPSVLILPCGLVFWRSTARLLMAFLAISFAAGSVAQPASWVGEVSLVLGKASRYTQ
ncbi:MAG TPA: hypothetical protein DEF79_13665, partial [Gammaproteobacteria bacterium]|nr:hypothetical protein [Gammaproteobacteria bacterium]